MISNASQKTGPLDANRVEIGGVLIRSSAPEETSDGFRRYLTLRCRYSEKAPVFPTFTAFGQIGDTLAELHQRAVCVQGTVDMFSYLDQNTGIERTIRRILLSEILSTDSPNLGEEPFDRNLVVLGGALVNCSEPKTTRGDDRRVVTLRHDRGEGIIFPKLAVFGDLGETLAGLESEQPVCLAARERTYRRSGSTGNRYTARTTDAYEILSASTTNTNASEA